MGSLSIGVHMNQFNKKKNTINHKKKKVHIKSTIPLRVRHQKKKKNLKIFFSIKPRDKIFINIHGLLIYWRLHEPIQSKKEKETHNQL